MITNNVKEILIVDDETIITRPVERLIKRALRRAREKFDQYIPVTANDPIKALDDLTRKSGPELALVIADIMMPQMNGLSFLAEVKNLYPMTPRIVLTGYADKENAIRALNELDLFYYVEKPWNDSEFGQLVLNALDRHRQYKLEIMFHRYVPYEVIEEFIDKSDAAILEGKSMEATILFLDIVDFTRTTERMDARSVVELLNEYFTVMVDVIHKRKGILDKFTGDGLLALFGVPSSGGTPEQDAANGVLAALDMVETVSRLNALRERSGLEPVRIRIGLDSGVVVAGNIGCTSRVNYTVVGDTVNTAQRIEDAARHVTPNGVGCVLISRNTYQRAKSILQDPILFAAQGPTALRGKQEKVHLYKVTS